MKAWELSEDRLVNSNFKKYLKAKPVEVSNCFANLEEFVNFLNETDMDPNFVTGFIRQERGNLVAADPSPMAPGIDRAVRFYAYCDKGERKVYVLFFGEKKNQSKDIQDALRMFT